MRNTKSSQKNSGHSIRGIIASIMLVSFALWLFMSIVGAPPASSELSNVGFNKFGGPVGAFAASHLVATFGYLSIFISALIILVAIGRIFQIQVRKIAVLGGEIISGHAILACLLGLPESGLSMNIVGNYGLTLSSTVKSVFGGLGSYIFMICLFLGFIAVLTRLDIRGSFQSAGKGISGIIIWLSARKERRSARKEATREEIFAKYSNKLRENHNPGGITGSLIPGDLSHPENYTEPVASIINEDQEVEPNAKETPSNYMEFIPPPIRRNAKTFKENRDFAPKEIEAIPPPPSGHLDTINPKTLHETIPIKKKSIPQLKNPFLSDELETEDKPKPIISQEPPLPEPVISNEKSPEIASIYENMPIEKAKSQHNQSKKISLLRPYKYTPPPLNILIDPEPDPESVSDGALHKQSQRLLETLRSFNVDGVIREICPGPVITRFELEPAVGVKVSRISNLADDIALALKAKDIRIVAPIPGKGAVGIEVPNDNSQIVRIKSEISSDDFNNNKYSLPLALGKRVDGTPAIADLTKMPHLLIAGATGSGKSVCINSIITSIIYAKSPKEVRLILIDPKRLELSVYKGIPHLAAPIVVEPKHASIALNWATEEMDSRYKLLSEVGVRSIADYNTYIDAHKEREDLSKLPYIMVIVDEMADLMVTVASEIEEPIARLAQMARAVGIHLIIATQRPSVDVITGLIKANFPSRIAFKVRSKIDSRTILDIGGAERLLGKGDMLYLPSGYAEAIRIHGCLITTNETERVVKYLRTFPNPFPDKILDMEKQANTIAAQVDQDELFWEAAKIIVMYQQGSTSFLQRKLRVGYTRAGCIIDQLEMAGIVGPFQGSKAREVLVKDLDSIDEMKESGVSV
ncbi:DNA translocase FtsK [bacterium]|nr:DNA translocase FtsK [bacterium]